MKFTFIDRRWIFLLILLGVGLPLIIPLGFKLEVSPDAQMVYDVIQSTNENRLVIVSFDYDPASKPELHPMGYAIIKHAIEKKHKVVCTALWPMGSQMADEIFHNLQKEMPELIYGENFINLGYKVGGMVTIQAMGKDMRNVYPKDASGKSIDDYPMLNNMKTIKDFAYVVSLSAGTPGLKDWIMVAKDKYGVSVLGGATAVSTPAFKPYVNDQKQLNGLLGGLKNAAEYEYLVGRKGTATAGMDAQSVAHLLIIAFIVLGNIAFFLNYKKVKE
ncbi:MAG TPA: hypothetical protein PL063_02005 [Candidatus Cloacimonadota bacterium]|jgi:hypothetical protein|nr:hypothetical protein [Candidatus Cloacimonadales bacterium]HOE91580.1 hypothetical protein [Candidatus Cloacimonadota bacterium]HOQ80089.1 hypothetical protein [Candidatus Cloacimonadota bacterium]HPY95967.1 hypothetical protein [Candidatus Cloacimonadota bacterium]HQB40427.1 hypothetical protein [Candidatus Cloacimonadota bacterium]